MNFRGLNGGNSLVRASLALAVLFVLSPAAFAQQNSTEANSTMTTDHAAGSCH